MNCFRSGWPVKPALFILALLLACGPVLGQVGFPQVTTTATAAGDSSRTASDSTKADMGQYKVVKKDLVPEDQVRIGTTIMFFIIVVMSFMNNFNPE